MTHIVAGSVAPGFSLKSLDGKEYSLNDLLQRGPVVAAFFKISCPVCQFTFPFLERLYKHYGGDGVTFLGISQDDARDTRDFAKEFGVTFPMLIDDEDGYIVSNDYGLTSVPTIFLIDTGGTVKVSSMGSTRKIWKPSPRNLPSAAKSRSRRSSVRTKSSPSTNPDEALKTRSGRT